MFTSKLFNKNCKLKYKNMQIYPEFLRMDFAFLSKAARPKLSADVPRETPDHPRT